MPNWCSNTLTVSGPSEEVARFRAKACGPKQDYVGPFNRDFSESEYDWGSFTPIHMEVLINNDDVFAFETTSVFSFHSLVPVPREVMLAAYDSETLKGDKERHPEWFRRFPGLIAGYDWEIRNWGCKWGASDESLNRDEGDMLSYSFDTPWSPPITLIEKVSSLFPSLSFKLSYCEEGAAFEGESHWENGTCIMEDEREIERNDSEEDDSEDDFEEE